MKKKLIKNNKITVAFAGGGTGGHIYPGLAIADELKKICEEKNIDINLIWLGSSKGMDRKIVENSLNMNSQLSVNQFYGIPSGKLRRYFSFKNFTDIFKIKETEIIYTSGASESNNLAIKGICNKYKNSHKNEKNKAQ